MAFADDVAVVTKTEDQLQEAINIWNEVLTRKGMRISRSKTEVMMVGRRRRTCNINLDGQQLKQVENFKYLGVVVNEKTLQEKEIASRIGKYNGNFHLFYPLLKDKHVPIKSKLVIYTTILRPLLIYSSEAWVLTTKTKSQIQAAEMKTLRLIKGVTKFDRLRSENIRRELGVDSILDIIERGRLRWYGHVKRMDRSRVAKKYLDLRPEGRRPVGRPRKRWMEGVSEAVESRNETLENVENNRLYEDRLAWRQFIRGGPIV